jgi:hypothetical protein
MTMDIVIARAAFPIELELSERAFPNRRPVKAVLFRANVRSIAPPSGADKPVVIDRRALETIDLDRLIGLPLHATEDLTAHWETDERGEKKVYSIGTITSVLKKDGMIVGSGYLWDIDFADLVENVRRAAANGELAVSWEMTDVVLQDEGDHYRILSFQPTGWALLRAQFAAYRDLMPALAAIADKRTYDPRKVELKVLLDDHRIMHAYYATLMRGGTISNWTVAEVVQMHAKIADEMLARHVQHRRGEGYAKALNEESLSKQAFKFFTDEVLNSFVDVWVNDDEEEVKSWIKSAEKHKPIELDSFPKVPEGLPVALQCKDQIVAIVAVARVGDSILLSVPKVFSEPLPASLASEAKSKFTLANEVLSSLPDVIVVPGYIAVTGSSLLTPFSQDLDLLICDNGKLERVAREVSTDKEVHITITDKPAGLSFPVYDLVLVKRPRRPIIPINEPEKLAPHSTVRVDGDLNSFLSARMRSLGDLDVYPACVYCTDMIPQRRGLLKADGNSVEIITDEDEVITFASDISERHPSCLTLTAEVWWVDGTWMVADCLWWNATKVAELPFPWRLSFAQKISDALVMPLVKWRVIWSPKEAPKPPFILQDSQAVYDAGRIVMLSNKASKAKEVVR